MSKNVFSWSLGFGWSIYISTLGAVTAFFYIVILSPMHRFEGAWFCLKHFLVVFRRRSLGFIAASRVSYGPLPEYKANQGKNYYNTDKMISLFFASKENTFLMDHSQNIKQRKGRIVAVFIAIRWCFHCL